MKGNLGVFYPSPTKDFGKCRATKMDGLLVRLASVELNTMLIANRPITRSRLLSSSMKILREADSRLKSSTKQCIPTQQIDNSLHGFIFVTHYPRILHLVREQSIP